MRVVFVVLWFVLLLGGCSRTSGGVGAVIDAVVDGVGDEETVRIYEVASLDAGDEVHPFAPEVEGGEVLPSSVDVAATLYLVDWAPDAGWSHPVSWVWVDADLDVLADEPHEWFPVLDGEAWLPNLHEPVWGVPGEAEEAADSFREDPDLDRAAPWAPDADEDECGRTRNVAIGVSTWNTQATINDLTTFSGYIRDIAEYETYILAEFSGTGQSRADALWSVFQAADWGSIPVEELVVFYSGHGARGGAWAFGDDGSLGLLTPEALAHSVNALGPQRVVLINASCHSAAFGARFAQAMHATEEGRRTEIRVISSSTAAEVSWLGKIDGKRQQYFTAALNDEYLSTWAEPAWDEVDIEPIVVPNKLEITLPSPGEHGGNYAIEVPAPAVQTASNVPTDFRVARIEVDPQMKAGATCLAADLGQSYGREMAIQGAKFGSEAGILEAMTVGGEWRPLTVTFWGESFIGFHMPMRADGFPSDDSSPDPLLDGVAQDAGLYTIRITTEEGSSHPAPVRIEPQHHTQTYTPPLPAPEWAELWHPMTPASEWTMGPTVQVSLLRRGDEPAAEWSFSGTGTPHATSAGMQAIPYWSYELQADWRDLATANEQSFPDFAYYGFRVVFTPDFFTPAPWEYELLYD